MHGSTLGKQSSGVAAAAADDSGSFAEVCHQGSDTAVAVAEGAAVLGRRVHFDAAGTVSHRVRFSEEGQQHNSSSGGPLIAPVSAKSGDQQQGRDNAHQQQQQGAPDSFGSSVDCRCVAAAPSSLDSPQELRRGKSLNKPARRYESWLVLELCDSGSLSSYTAQWDPPSHDPASILQVLQLLLDTARGLEALHRANTVHGDLVSGLNNAKWGFSINMSCHCAASCVARCNLRCGTWDILSALLLL
jgi:serine/threonine protein kinase